jgi:hypothetical protein
LALLQTEVGRWRASQLHHKKQKTPLDHDFAATVGMLARSVKDFTAEMRKAGKDLRQREKEYTLDERLALTVEFLLDVPVARRAEVLAQVNQRVSDG